MNRIKDLLHAGLPTPGAKPKVEENIPVSYPKSEYRYIADGPTNPMVDSELIESMDDAYYDFKTDISVFEFKKLPSNPSQEIVNEIRKNLHRQLNAVLKKLSEVILESQPSYQKELVRVRELEQNLKTAHEICNSGKNNLLLVPSQASLRLLYIVQHRRNLSNLHQALATVKTLEHTDVRLRELLDDEDYPEAIQLCVECQKAANIYKQYSCIKDLSSKLQDTLELIEEQIDVALSKTCSKFDNGVYGKLQLGYKLLGKPQTAVDQLLMHFTSCIHTTAFQTVAEFGNKASEKLTHKKQFKDLCSNIDMSDCIPCLISLCKALWNIMRSYYKVTLWHTQDLGHMDQDELQKVEFDRKYIQQKLEHGRHRVWLDVQSRVRVFLTEVDLSNFKYDEFIKVLHVAKRLVSIGEEFCGKKDEETEENPGSHSFVNSLDEPIYQQSSRYFQNYHQKCFEELHMFLENEAWEPCPIRVNFSLLQLPEFNFLHEATYHDIIRVQSQAMCSDPNAISTSYFGNTQEKFTPFNEFEKQKGDVRTANGESMFRPKFTSDDFSDDEMSEELLKDYVDERTGDHAASEPSTKTSRKHKGPVLTNTGLNVLRTCGKYMKMCDVIKPIAMDVITCMTQLFDFYLFCVVHFFVTKDHSRPRFSEKLSAVLPRIKDEIMILQGGLVETSDGAEVNGAQPSNNIMLPFLSPFVTLDQKKNFYGFSFRIIATESLMNLAHQFQNLRPNLEKLIPKSKQAFLHHFYSQTISTCPEVQSSVYYDIASKCIDYDMILLGMEKVKWDIHEIMSQHSGYVDELLHQFHVLKVMISSADTDVPVTPEIYEIIWKHCILLANKTLVEGYSNVKKCSNEGRALMQLDFQQYLMKIDELTKVRPVPGKEFVEGYIKAFYLTEEDLELWMKNHPEYTKKQLGSLVQCSASSHAGNTNKRNRQRMLSLIDDLTGRK